MLVRQLVMVLNGASRSQRRTLSRFNTRPCRPSSTRPLEWNLAHIPHTRNSDLFPFPILIRRIHTLTRIRTKALIVTRKYIYLRRTPIMPLPHSLLIRGGKGLTYSLLHEPHDDLQKYTRIPPDRCTICTTKNPIKQAFQPTYYEAHHSHKLMVSLLPEYMSSCSVSKNYVVLAAFPRSKFPPLLAQPSH